MIHEGQVWFMWEFLNVGMNANRSVLSWFCIRIKFCGVAFDGETHRLCLFVCQVNLLLILITAHLFISLIFALETSETSAGVGGVSHDSWTNNNTTTLHSFIFKVTSFSHWNLMSKLPLLGLKWTEISWKFQQEKHLFFIADSCSGLQGELQPDVWERFELVRVILH